MYVHHPPQTMYFESYCFAGRVHVELRSSEKLKCQVVVSVERLCGQEERVDRAVFWHQNSIVVSGCWYWFNGSCYVHLKIFIYSVLNAMLTIYQGEA